MASFVQTARYLDQGKWSPAVAGKADVFAAFAVDSSRSWDIVGLIMTSKPFSFGFWFSGYAKPAGDRAS